MTLKEKRKEIYEYVRSLGIDLDSEKQEALSKHLHEYHKIAFANAPGPQKVKTEQTPIKVKPVNIKAAYPDTGISSYKPKAQTLCITRGHHEYDDGTRVWHA